MSTCMKPRETIKSAFPKKKKKKLKKVQSLNGFSLKLRDEFSFYVLFGAT